MSLGARSSWLDIKKTKQNKKSKKLNNFQGHQDNWLDRRIRQFKFDSPQKSQRAKFDGI